MSVPSTALPNSVAELPQVVLKPRRALPFFSFHPWVFSGAIAEIRGHPEPGCEVALVSDGGECIARGLYNPHSKIAVRLYSWQPETPLDAAFFSRRLDEALRLRERLFPQQGAETACRLVFSEADGLSGLIVDRYGDWLVVQFTSLALATRQALLLELLQEKCRPEGIWLRTEKGIGRAEGLPLTDGLLSGRDPPRPLFIEEHGIRYGVDVVQGQKTGFYLDQRANRAAIAGYLDGGHVLDLFCYSGSFGLAALHLGGVQEVTGIDTSEPALTLARNNAELNHSADRMHFEKAKVFDALQSLQENGRRFDAVFLDPPKLARSRGGLKKALRGYHSLNRMAVDVLKPDGILLTCSCSGLVTSDHLEEMLANVAAQTGRRIQLLETRGPSPDHPTSVHCRETAYLKCWINRVL